MDFVKRMFTAIFSTEFLLKILIISAIFAVLQFVDRGIRIYINHDIGSHYGGIEIVLKDKR